MISHPLYLGLSQPAATQEQLQAQAKVESSGGFSKRYPGSDEKVFEGAIESRPPFWSKMGFHGFTKLAVGRPTALFLH